MIFDRYGRPFATLRIAVTRRCNFKCFFCHLEGAFETSGGKLRTWEIGVLAEASRRLEARRFKLTGGEPLIRSDIVEIVGEIKRYGDPEDLSMTTNGSLLDRYAYRLAEAGLNRVNVSLHSLRREVFRRITGVDALESVLKGIEAAYDAGLTPIKLNYVVLKGLNDNELWDLVEYAGRINARLQVIELHPVGLGAVGFTKYHYPATRVARMLEDHAEKIIVREELHMRPIYRLSNGVEVELVGPVGNYWFCSRCTRIRVLPDGSLSPCLNWKGPFIPAAEMIRRAKSREEAVEKAVKALIKANRLRRPYYMFPLEDGSPSLQLLPRRNPWLKPFRLGLPKPDGRLA